MESAGRPVANCVVDAQSDGSWIFHCVPTSTCHDRRGANRCAYRYRSEREQYGLTLPLCLSQRCRLNSPRIAIDPVCQQFIVSCLRGGSQAFSGRTTSPSKQENLAEVLSSKGYDDADQTIAAARSYRQPASSSILLSNSENQAFKSAVVSRKD